MVVIVNGYFEVGYRHINHSAIWEDVNNKNMTIGNLIDQITSYTEKVKTKFFEEANDIFETPVILKVSNIKFLFEKFDGVDDILLKFDYASGKISIDDIRDIVLLRDTQVVQFIDKDEEYISELFAVPKMFYTRCEAGVKRTDFDLFNNTIKGCSDILSKCVGELKDFKFKYINPFNAAQIFEFKTYDFISSDQLSLSYIYENITENCQSLKTNILSIDGMKVAIDDIIYFMEKCYNYFDDKLIKDIFYDRIENIKNGYFEDLRTLYCDLRYISKYFNHTSLKDQLWISKFINNYFNDSVQILKLNGYDIGVDSEEKYISEKLKEYSKNSRVTKDH